MIDRKRPAETSRKNKCLGLTHITCVVFGRGGVDLAFVPYDVRDSHSVPHRWP